MTAQSLTHLFTVEAEADPQLPARVLGLFTQRGLLPAWFSARCTAPETLRIVVEIRGLDIPSVLHVSQRCPLPRSALVA
jgi:hypothetical protein